jgi:hypothetical protein
MTDHQLKQQEVIDKLAEQVNSQTLKFSTVAPVDDYENDTRVCLTSVHLPHLGLLRYIQKSLIEPLHKIEPSFYFYSTDSLHLTIKNIRVSNYPPHFNESDINKAQKTFSEIIPRHKKFNVYFYRLLLFPNNLALIGTTDSELDNIILDLDKALKIEGLVDDKIYVNSQYFFSNMTLARFNSLPSEEFKKKVNELSDSIKFTPYLVDSVTLLKANSVFKKRQIFETWKLPMVL